MRQLALVMTTTALLTAAHLAAQRGTVKPTAVTVDNFNRAETDSYFADTVRRAGGTGVFNHIRGPMPVNDQAVIRTNRDTLYSAAVFDLDAAPVTVTLPESGKRFMSMLAINEDHYALSTVYAPGRFTYTKDQVGTRYVMLGVRTFVNPDSTDDLKQAHALQDAINTEQQNRGTFQAPSWDPVSRKKVRDALVVLAGTIPDTKGMYGPKDRVDPVRHLVGTATGWGANAEQDATYLSVVPGRNDGKTIYRLTVKDVPVDGFWSITVYNAKGYLEANPLNMYSLNNTTGKREPDGSFTVQFGGCDGKVPNCLPIPPGWNYWVRLYRPRPEILNGAWKFPEAKPIG